MKKLFADPKKPTGVKETPPPVQVPSKDKEKEEIARLAYQFYVERGRKHGYDKQDWLRAEEIVKKTVRKK